MTSPRDVLLNYRDAQHVLNTATNTFNRARESFKECFKPDHVEGLKSALDITAMTGKKMEVTLGFCEDMIYGCTVRPPAVVLDEELLRKALLERGMDDVAVEQIIIASKKQHDVYYGRHRKEYFARFV